MRASNENAPRHSLACLLQMLRIFTAAVLAPVGQLITTSATKGSLLRSVDTCTVRKPEVTFDLTLRLQPIVQFVVGMLSVRFIKFVGPPAN
jgi:hypothetical protein